MRDTCLPRAAPIFGGLPPPAPGGKIWRERDEERRSPVSEATYICSVCAKKIKVGKGKPVPLCCRKEMEPLPFCTTAPNPEMARNYEADEPCDDGTLAKKK